MRTWIDNHDLKRLVQGVAGVAACGLVLGAAMHPNLDVGERPGGPQMLQPAGGARAGIETSDAGIGVYATHIPDYVIGSDWTRPPAMAAGAAAPAPEASPDETMVFTSQDALEVTRAEMIRAERTQAAWRDEPREPPAYPSARGGAYYEADLPAPPPEPYYDDEDADEG